MVAAVRIARSWWLRNPRRAWGLIASLTALAVLFSALNALAATITYDPTAVSETAWTRTGGTTSAGVLADTSDATYMYTTTTASPMYVAMGDPAGMSGVITNVQLFVDAAESGTGTSTIRLGLGQANAMIAGGWATGTHVANGTTMITFSDSWATDPRGGAWTWADITALQGVVQEDVASTTTLQIGKMWIVVTYSTDTTPPTLDSASASDSTHVVVVFSEAIDAATVSAADFSIPGLTISGVSVSGSTVTLTTTTQDATGYTVSCALGNVADMSGNGNTAGSASFTGVDGIAPTLVSASSTDATHVQVQFSEPITSGSVAASDFSIPGLSVTGASVSGSTVTLTTSVQDAVSYTVTCAAGNVSDAAGNGNTAGSDAFTGTDGIPPALVSATSSDATHVSVVFSEPLTVGSVADTDFSIPGLTVTGVSVSGATVTLTTTTQDGVAYTLTCGAGNVTDVAGNGNTAGSGTFTGVDGVRPQIVWAASATATRVDVTFSEALAAASVAADGSDFQIPGLTVTAAVLDVNGVTVHLTTSSQDGITYTAGCVNGVVADLAGNGNASGSAEFSGTDGIPPEVSSAHAVDATHVDVVFSEALQPGSISAADFTIAGLTLSAAVLDADGVTVHLTTSTQSGGADYTVSCAAGRVLDVAGNPNLAGNASFLGYDNTPPTLDSASAPNTTHVDLLFSEALRESSVEVSDFVIAGLTVSEAVLDVDGVTVHLTTSAHTAGKAYTVACAAGNVLNLSGVGNTAGSVGFTGSSIADSEPPSAPGSVTAVAGGSSPAIASISWTASTDNIGVAGYRIYRSTSEAGPYSTVGTTVGLSFADVTGVPGQEYWYSVAAYDAAGNESTRASATGVPVIATWTIEPHDAYTVDTRLCRLCHEPHEAATSDNIFRPVGGESGELGVCYACHDGSGASDNIKTGATNAFTGGSGHALEATDPATDLTNGCSSCHGPHRDYTTSPMLPKQTVNGASVTAADNTWCLACHDAANSWYAPDVYPSVAEPSRDDTGYPIAGTFPGPATYTSATANAHASIPASATATREAGDCLYCHSSHRGISAYDGLVGEFKPPVETNPTNAAYDEYAEACFVCHGSTNTYGFAAPPQNIQQYVMAGGERSGHRIETAGGLYDVGTPLPCYECHNPHGSTRGNEKLFSDVLGQDLKVSGANAAEAALNVRRFCFTCHTTGDAAPKAWDSEANGGLGAYVAVTDTDTIVGLYRDGHTSTAAVNRLRIPAVAGHYQADTQSCGSCHGSDYGIGGANVHNPTGGASDGGIACYSCHNYQANMEDLAGGKAGDPTLLDDSAHHVMGGSGVEGDIAPKDSATGYPTSQNDVYCVSCHTDHNYFNGNKGANLRTDLSSTSGASAANTDFIASNPSGGICLSCHTTTKSKQNMGTEQLNAGAATTPAIDRAAYDASAHDYTVTSTFGTSAFDANCSKCHSDEQAKEYSSVSGYRFGTHWSTKVGILGALGASLPAMPKAEACLKCHNDTAQPYGAVIAAPANTTADEFAMTSSHDLTKVTCVNCHNVHEASAANPAADPENTYNVAPLTTKSDANSYCLKCHDASLPVQTANDTTLIPYTVTAGSRANVSTYYTTGGHGTPESGTSFTGRTNTGYASSFSAAPSTPAWADGGFSTGAPNGTIAVSPTGNVFDGRQSFTIPTPITTITNATLTVRSRAAGNWGQVLSAGGTVYKNATAAPQNVVGTAGGSYASLAASDNTRWTLQENTTTRRASAEFNSWQTFTESDVGRISSLVVEAEGYNNNAASESAWVRFWDYSTAAWSTTWYQLGTTNWALGTTDGVRNTAAITSVSEIAKYFNASGVFRLQFADDNQRLTTNDGTTSTWGLDVLRLRIDYSGDQYDDTWAIQYTTDGTTWTNVAPASTTAEAALTDHTVTVTGLTPANFADFRVRILGATVNGADNVGTIQWDSSTLTLTYDGTDPGLVKTSCRDCHEQHGSSLVHLLSTTAGGEAVPEYSDVRDQAQCLACHDSDGPAASANIARYYPTTAFGEAAQSGTLPTGTRFGHRIKNGAYAGQAMPCRSCHNPHGAASGGYMLAVRTQINSTTDTVLGDQPGELAMSVTDQQTDANVRNFCFACHTTSDTTAGWNGSTMVVITSGQVMGIDRTGGLLKLPARKGHAASDTDSCYVCHGDDFTQSTSVNVHNPASGESLGGIACYKCHTVYRDQMEDNAGTEQGGAARLQGYHHVLGNGTTDGDNAFTPTTYPTTVAVAPGNTGVYCLSCHVDHDKFSPLVNSAFDRSNNLRTDYTAASPTATNTDFNSTSNASICLGCHAVAQAKDNTNQKAESASTRTPSIGAAQFAASAHDYYATSTFQDSASATSTFNANCSKCHDSEIDGGGMEQGTKTSGYQSSTDKFSVHYSANRRILAAMGVAVADPPGEEDTCLACHSLSTDALKDAANRDWYNASAMNATSQGIFGLMANTYRHNVSGYDGLHRPSTTDETRAYLSANKHVECADCHNVHVSTTARHTMGLPNGNLVSGALTGVSGASATFSGTNWTSPTAYTLVDSATYEYQICFKCHSAYNQNTQAQGQTTLITWGGTGSQAWTDQALEFSPSNQSYHPVVAALPVTDPGTNGSSRLQAEDMRPAYTVGGVTYGGWVNGDTMYCSDCHAQSNAGSLGPHGSAVKWMLKGPNQAWPYDTAANNGANITTQATFRTLAEQDTNLDTVNGNFCRNCHNMDTNNKEHRGESSHDPVPCVGCHIRVPHGGKSSRLQAGNGSLTTYPGNLPARYTPNGAGQSFTTAWWVNDIHKQAGGTYDGRETCGITYASGEPCGGSHDHGSIDSTDHW